jgi:7-carboxy-7-deazaguanine synthase
MRDVLLPVNEVFGTIQGEGSYTGTPAVFIRLQGCPVGCPWCDTKQTWTLDPNLSTSRDKIEAKTADSAQYAMFSVAGLLDAIAGFRQRHVVLTGGEPCLYDLRPLTEALADRGYYVQIETSGTHEIRVAAGTWVTVSPKWDMPGGLAVRDDALQRADELKCAVGSPADIERVSQLQVAAPIWLQPLSLSAKATQLCVAAAIEHGWKLSLQTHKFAGVR